MFNLVFLLLSGLPLVGLIMMEAGAAGPDIGEFGHSNGAAAAYAAHLAVMCAAYGIVFTFLRLTVLPSGRVTARNLRPRVVYDTIAFRHLARRALVLNLLQLAFVLFVSGASRVVLGELDKGQFRTQARFGYVAFLARDCLSPMLSALVAYVYMRSVHGRRETVLLSANLLVTAISGAIWGYRASLLMMLIPAALMLVRRMTLTRALGFVGGGLAIVVLASVYYQGAGYRAAFEGAITRASVGTANAAWRIWDLEMTAPTLIPDYAPTLTAAFGWRVLSLFGVDPNAPLDVSRPADYSTLATLLAKNFSQGVDATSNVTTTVFGEGVVAFGARGFLLMSLVAGLIVGFVRAILEFGQQHFRPLVAVMAASYFMVSVFSWLNSGGVAVLFFVPLLTNYVITYWVARSLLRTARIPIAIRRPTPRPDSDADAPVLQRPALEQP